MKVHELIEELQKMPPDAELWCSASFRTGRTEFTDRPKREAWSVQHGHRVTVPALEASAEARAALTAWLSTPAPGELVA